MAVIIPLYCTMHFHQHFAGFPLERLSFVFFFPYPTNDAEPSGYCKDGFPIRKLFLTERWQKQTHRGPKAFLSGFASISRENLPKIGWKRCKRTSRTCGQRVCRVTGNGDAARLINPIRSTEKGILFKTFRGKLPTLSMLLDGSYAAETEGTFRYRRPQSVWRVARSYRVISARPSDAFASAAGIR